MSQNAFLSPSPVFQFVNQSGQPLSGGLVFTYANNTTTMATTYVDGTSNTPNTNPIVLDSYGCANIWLPPGQVFTFVISPSTDTNPPTNPIKTINGISSGNATINWGIDTGAVNAISITTIGVSSLVPGIAVTAQIAYTNTGPVTLNVSGTGPKPVVLPNGSPLSGGELQGGGDYLFQWNGTNWQLFVSTEFIPQTAAEIAAGVTPTNYQYPPGYPRRYGAVGDNVTDDTVAVQTAFNVSGKVTFTQSDFYKVSTITQSTNNQVIDFNGGFLNGNASPGSPQTCILLIKGSFCAWYNVSVFNLGNGGSIASPNPNYQCAVQMYNSSGPLQYTDIFGLTITCAQRGLVYGALPGTVPTGSIQSENVIHGFRTVGCSNPLYNNAYQGFLHLVAPILYAGFEDWTVASVSTARALENYGGNIFVQGGEVEYASQSVGYAADLAGVIFVGTNFETAPPIQIVGDGVQFVSCGLSNTGSAISEIKVQSGVTGTLKILGSTFQRSATVGSFSRATMIDASSAGLVTFSVAPTGTSTALAAAWVQPGSNAAAGTTFTPNLVFSDGEIKQVTLTQGATTCTWTGALTGTPTVTAYLQFATILEDSYSTEWAWTLVGNNCRLVTSNPGGTVSYRNHRMNITAADPYTYRIDSPGDSLLDGLAATFDRLGYSTNGWTETVIGGAGTTFTNTTNPGPVGYLASQLTLHATGNYTNVTPANPSTLTTLQATAFRCTPNEQYWVSCWLKISSGTDGRLGIQFFNLAGTAVGFVFVADYTGIGSGVWTYVEGPVAVASIPSTAAYMSPTVYGNTSDVQITDLRVRRAI